MLICRAAKTAQFNALDVQENLRGLEPDSDAGFDDRLSVLKLCKSS